MSHRRDSQPGRLDPAHPRSAVSAHLPLRALFGFHGRLLPEAKWEETPLPAAVDALIQLETADQLEAAGRHDEAVGFASNAVEECPGHEDLLAWEKRLGAGDHDPNFSCHKFLFGKEAGAELAGHKPTIQPE
jgi:hypothetical protein